VEVLAIFITGIGLLALLTLFQLGAIEMPRRYRTTGPPLPPAMRLR
jgi:hypothetical protein